MGKRRIRSCLTKALGSCHNETLCCGLLMGWDGLSGGGISNPVWRCCRVQTQLAHSRG